MHTRYGWLALVVVGAAQGCGSSVGGDDQVRSLTSALAPGAVDLIAMGSISGNISDLSTETAAALENGVAGNLLGGLGSGIAYAGGDTFVAVPDRGPNAKPYNFSVDDTTSYINRFQTFTLSLAPSADGAALPFTLSATLDKTTLLSTKDPLVYGAGGAGLASGTPSLNKKNTQYLTGRSDGFDPSQNSGNPNDGRFDPEGIRIARDGEHAFVTDEYGPYVYEFQRENGKRKTTFALPPEFYITNLSSQGAVEITGNAVGRISNKGMEGLAITPDGSTLYGAMQSPLEQDGGTSAPITRIVKIDLKSGAVSQYAYELTNIGSASSPKYPTISEILAINSHELLVDERDGKGLGDDSVASYKKIYRIDLTNATEVSGFSGAGLAGKAVSKTLFLDIVLALKAHGFATQDIPAKLEGMAFGHDVVIGGATAHTLFVTNDNDFVGTVVDTHHPAGIDNPNRFFVFAIDPAALPTYEPQVFEND